MRLKRVVRDLNRASIKVVVSGEDGLLSEIEYNWQDRAGSKAALPENWYSTVEGEHSLQRKPETGATDIYDMLPK